MPMKDKKYGEWQWLVLAAYSHSRSYQCVSAVPVPARLLQILLVFNWGEKKNMVVYWLNQSFIRWML